ncbi:MAG TPA: NAD(P)H-dependent oxidoreductase [Solirubrobacteraceae bacterium]|jgi:FMN-dependent NADH-azoreductase|nr:NAD(P)H-dependent oxidoreductase [Solirubrobacteraceae bacterium]
MYDQRSLEHNVSHLLHIDSSYQGERSVSRALSARAAARWRAAHPGGTVKYRDLGSEPLPHITSTTAHARMLPAEQHTAEHAESWALTVELIDEIKAADTIILGLPLYNFGPPSQIKSWVDHLIAPGLSVDAETHEGLLGGREFIVLAARGGGYGAGTPRAGWDHAEPWLPHSLSLTGLEPRFITAELTLANVNPAMAELIPLADESRAAAERAVDELWSPLAAAV